MTINNVNSDALGENFGITYSVENSSLPCREIVEEQLVPSDGVFLLPRAGKLELRLRAHAPDSKGNSIKIVLPLDGLRLLLNEVDRRELESNLERRLAKAR
jgi:hypothetical protein